MHCVQQLFVGEPLGRMPRNSVRRASAGASTHYCGWTRDGRFIVKRKTRSKRLTRKLKELRREAWRHVHAPLAEQHRWYASILRGHYGYYGLPQLPGVEGIRPGGPANMARVPAATKPDGQAHELGSLQGCAQTLPSA
jgi:hypothetical protein